MRTATIFCALVISLLSTAVRAENWPSWRGPRGDGTSLEKNIPTEWDGASGKNIVWKVPVHGQGHASPIVWGDHLFVPSCDPTTGERLLTCIDNRTGKSRWQKVVTTGDLESKHSLNSFASSTPATDGSLVYVSFFEVHGEKIPARNVGSFRLITPGRMVVAAYDFAGNQQWIVRPGPFVSAHGYCSNPVLFENLVIINGDHDGDSYIVALEKTTGKEVWRTARRHKTRSYVTPIIRQVDARTQMVFSGSKCVVSLDPRTGTRHWSVDGPTEQFVASPVYDGERFFVTGGFPTHHVIAIRPDGDGDVSESHVAWHSTNVRCYVPSPVLVDKYLFVADDRGTANCFDTVSGERLWQARLGRHYSASLVTAGGLVYFLADDGETKIVRPGPKLDVVAQNSLGEYCYASAALADGQIYLRGEKNLYRIGAK